MGQGMPLAARLSRSLPKVKLNLLRDSEGNKDWGRFYDTAKIKTTGG
jgi:hypothetical protein